MHIFYTLCPFSNTRPYPTASTSQEALFAELITSTLIESIFFPSHLPVIITGEAETFALFEKRNLEAGQRDWIKTTDLLLSSTEEYDTEELHIGFIHIKKESPLFTQEFKVANST